MLQYAEDSYEKDLASALLMSKLEVEEKKVVGAFTLGGGDNQRDFAGWITPQVDYPKRNTIHFDLLCGGLAV